MNTVCPEELKPGTLVWAQTPIPCRLWDDVEVKKHRRKRMLCRMKYVPLDEIMDEMIHDLDAGPEPNYPVVQLIVRSAKYAPYLHVSPTDLSARVLLIDAREVGLFRRD